MKYLLLIFSVALLSSSSYAQIDSSVRTLDTTRANADTGRRIDSIKRVDSAIIKSVVHKPDTSYNKLYRNPYLPGTVNPLYLVIEQRKEPSKDNLFYLVSALLLFLAFVKLVFPKYFQNIFRLFFQPSFRQKQTREQLLQNNLPSLLLNLFFLFTGGAYIALLFLHFQLFHLTFFILFAYTTGALALLYVAKYLFLSFSGWVFNVKEAISTYIFVIYLINKIIGILLIPFILMLAFSNPQITEAGITVSIILLFVLFLYRYIISFSPVTREIKVNPLHFFFYICAFEITPLLLIYKLLANYLHRSL